MNNQVVVITGVSRGLGRALVDAFADEGATVIGFARSKEAIDSIASQLSGKKFHGYLVDVSNGDAVQKAVSDIISRFGQIDVLFNNAAVYPRAHFLDESWEDWMLAMAINLGGPSNCAKAVLPYMISAKRGKIYNVGSWADRSPIPNSSAYSTSKGGLHPLTKSIAADLDDRDCEGVEVHEWIPGHLNTRMSDFTGIDPAVSARWAVDIVQMPSQRRHSIFENDREWFPPKGLRARVKDALFFWKGTG